MKTLQPLALAAALAAVGAAQADTGTVVVSASLPFTDTDWSSALMVPQFNNPLVHLDSVDIAFAGSTRNSMQFENRNPNARDYAASVSYDLVLSTPTQSALLDLEPTTRTVSGTLAAFDGTVDYAGASGVSYPQETDSDSGGATLSAAADVAPFVGTGTVALPVDAEAYSQVTSSGNFDEIILTQANASVQITYHYSYTPAKIGDRVWYDANGNGVQDGGEAGISGVKVVLLDGKGNAVLDASGNPLTTTTDGNGNYHFAGLVPGQYQVQFVAPAGTAFTGSGQGGNAALDSDADATTGKTAVFTLHSGDDNEDLDAGLVGLQSIGDRVWLDSNNDGIQEDGEPGLASVGVTLLDGSGNSLGSTTTDGNGLYHFTGLLPGSYQVRFDPIGGYQRTAPGAGTDRTKDSDADANGLSGTIVLKAGDNRTDIDAGYKGSLMLGDYVWLDANNDGIQQATEHGIPGVTVSLLDVNGKVMASQITDANGGYLFTDLLPGKYQIKVSAPDGYTFSTRGVGANPAVDSDVDGSGLTPVIALTADNLSVDAGLHGTLSLGDRVWKDLNKNGIQDSCEPGVPGVAVHLLDANGVDIEDATTDANGLYKFTNLVPGNYTVKFDAPAGYGFTKTGAGTRTTDSNPDPTSGKASVMLSADDLTVDAGLVGALKIGDTVWLDCDGDGVFDVAQGEKGIPGVHVYLLGDTDGDGRVDTVAQTVTDKDGHYLFLGLLPGVYQVSVNPYDLPRNVYQTTKYGTSIPFIDFGKLTTAGDNLDFDFGFRPYSAPCGCSHKWWCCNLPCWTWDCLWVGGKCHTKAMICAWMKRDDCGDKSICLYQRLCAAKLNVGGGCNEGKVYTCGKTTCTLKDAIKCADAWMASHPVGCNVSATSKDWTSICDVFAILDAHCNGK